MDASSELVMYLDSNASVGDRGLKTVSKLCTPAFSVGGKSLDFQTVPIYGDADYGNVEC